MEPMERALFVSVVMGTEAPGDTDWDWRWLLSGGMSSGVWLSDATRARLLGRPRRRAGLCTVHSTPRRLHLEHGWAKSHCVFRLEHRSQARRAAGFPTEETRPAMDHAKQSEAGSFENGRR